MATDTDRISGRLLGTAVCPVTVERKGLVGLLNGRYFGVVQY